MASTGSWSGWRRAASPLPRSDEPLYRALQSGEALVWGAMHATPDERSTRPQRPLAAGLRHPTPRNRPWYSSGSSLPDKETIWTAPHSAYGSSGIQLVDLNGDGKLDVLST